MNGPRICAGYGIAAHPADGALVDVTAPVAMRLCGPCWRRWIEVREQPDWSADG